MLNNVILMGRLTQNPEIRQTNSGATSCSFSIAIDRPANQNGERQADFIRCTAWNKTAEWMSKYTEKGTMLIVEGSLRTGSYTDKKYPDVTHYTMDVWANRVSYGETKAAHELSKQNAGNRNENNYNNNYSQPNRTPAPAKQNTYDNFPPQMGGLSDFEEVISDSDLPF
jgi:single-strand DNA-binding protein